MPTQMRKGEREKKVVDYASKKNSHKKRSNLILSEIFNYCFERSTLIRDELICIHRLRSTITPANNRNQYSASNERQPRWHLGLYDQLQLEFVTSKKKLIKR